MKMEKESKFIAYILRHKPEAIGIRLDEQGWASVAALIAGINAVKGYRLDMDILRDIVATDEKQRYRFNEDETLIRANQGHSVAVDVELTEKDPPEFLYHGTAERFSPSIECSGLLPGSRLYVHLSEEASLAKTVGARHGIPIVYQIAAGLMRREGYRFFISENGVWLTKEVPAKYLIHYQV